MHVYRYMCLVWMWMCIRRSYMCMHVQAHVHTCICIHTCMCIWECMRILHTTCKRKKINFCIKNRGELNKVPQNKMQKMTANCKLHPNSFRTSTIAARILKFSTRGKKTILCDTIDSIFLPNTAYVSNNRSHFFPTKKSIEA